MRTKEFKRLVLAREVVATRTEAQLVHDFSAWLQSAHGLTSSGLTIPYDPEGRNLRADLFIHSPEVLIEAKSSSAREHLRTALGQSWTTPDTCRPALGSCASCQTDQRTTC